MTNKLEKIVTIEQQIEKLKERKKDKSNRKKKGGT